MDRRSFLAATGIVVLAAPLAADTQQAGPVRTIGILRQWAASGQDEARAARAVELSQLLQMRKPALAVSGQTEDTF